MEKSSSSRKSGLKICCGITAILFTIITVAALVVFLTVLKPKKPKLSTKSVTLDHVKLVPFPFHLNVTIGVLVTIDNRNYGSFMYGNSTTYVTYRGTPAAEAPIQADTMPARANHDIATELLIVVDALTTNPYFWADYNTAGCLNFTSTTSLNGKANVLKLFNIKLTTCTTCDISLFVKTQNLTSVCNSKLSY